MKEKTGEFLKEQNPESLEEEIKLLNKDFNDLNTVAEREVFEFFESQLDNIFETLSINYSIEDFSRMQSSFKDIIVAYYGENNKHKIDRLNTELQEGKFIL